MSDPYGLDPCSDCGQPALELHGWTDANGNRLLLCASCIDTRADDMMGRDRYR